MTSRRVLEYRTLFRIGEPCDVDHDGGAGGTKTDSGELLDIDDQGFIVIRSSHGKLIYIPRPKVLEVRQPDG